jgi:hypothetical protein
MTGGIFVRLDLFRLLFEAVAVVLVDVGYLPADFFSTM